MNPPKLNISFNEMKNIMFVYLPLLTICCYAFDVINHVQFASIISISMAFKLGNAYRTDEQDTREAALQEREKLGDELLLLIKEKFPNEWKEIQDKENKIK